MTNSTIFMTILLFLIVHHCPSLMAQGQYDVCRELNELGNRKMFETNKGLFFHPTKQFHIYRKRHFWITTTSLKDIVERGSIAVRYQGERKNVSSD